MKKTTMRGSYRTGRDRVEAILDAAHELFIGTGYRATSLRDIARESGITHPALLRYFPSRGAILTALIERLDTRTSELWAQEGEIRVPTPADIARASLNKPGWIELFTALLGEAADPDHPGHTQMLARRSEAVRMGTQAFTSFGLSRKQAELELRQLMAGWEGLQILWLYFPGQIDIPTQLDQHALGGAMHTDPTANPPQYLGHPRLLDGVAAAAMRLYAKRGYYETSMQAIADEAGITKAALVHIAPTKAALLMHVLRELHGADIDGKVAAAEPTTPPPTAAAELVLLCEATVPSHPAHNALKERLSTARDELTRILSTGGHQEPAAEADWLIGVALGNLVEWLYAANSTPAQP